MLFRRVLHIDPTCPLCLEDIESLDHPFLECPVTRHVLEGAAQHGWVPPGLFHIGTSFCDHLWGLGSDPQSSIVAVKVSFLLWRIWKCRNNVVFHKGIFHPLACLISAKMVFAE